MYFLRNISNLKSVPKPVEDKVRSQCERVVDHVEVDGAVLPHLPPPVSTAAQRYSFSQLIQAPLVHHSQGVRVHLVHIWVVSHSNVAPYVLVSWSKFPQHDICIVKTIDSTFHHLKNIPVENVIMMGGVDCVLTSPVAVHVLV